MCISASVSFATSAVLIPAGLYAIRRAAIADRSYLPFAGIPLAFGVLQGLEGGVWLAMEDAPTAPLMVLAFGFLFFSHFFWPLWAPISAYWMENAPHRRSFMRALIWVGGIFGASLYLPMLAQGWVEVGVQQGAIDYRTSLIYDGLVPRVAVHVFYAALVLLPFLVSTRRTARFFGLLIALSVAVAYGFYQYAFISVWCLIAAWVSLVVVLLVHRDTRLRTSEGQRAAG